MSEPIVLSTTETLTLELSSPVVINQPEFMAHYIDTTDDTTGAIKGVFNSTTPVTAVTSPAAGKRHVFRVDVTNLDTANALVIAKVTGGTTRNVRYRLVSYSECCELLHDKPVGEKGDRGSQGSQGNQGLIGIQGYQGFGGTQGFQGEMGPQGVQGNQGFTGIQGNQGNQGEIGGQGNQGNVGSGIQGPQGTNPGVQGPQGNGVQGNQGLEGSGAQGNQGNQGDAGSQGNQGNQGDIGNQGNQGTLGLQGLQGTNPGPQGNIGIGVQGFQGWQGTGSQGPSATGTQGNQGFQGSGVQGPSAVGVQGNQGGQGNQGVAGTSAGSTVYSFRVDFTGASQVSSTSDYPAGWSESTHDTTSVTVLHDVGVQIKHIVFRGHRAASPEWHYRVITATAELTCVEATKTTLFKVSMSASAAGSEASGYAYVDCYF